MNRHAVLVSLVDAHRPAERSAAQRYKQYVARVNSEIGKPPRTPIAHSEVSYDDYIAIIDSLHRDAGKQWDWREIGASPPPPSRREHEAAAQKALDSYKPTFLEWSLRRAEGRRQELAAAVARAQATDQELWRDVCDQWNWCQQLARSILQRDIRAYRAAVEQLGPFEQLEHLGIQVEIRVTDPSFLEAFVKVRHDAVPYTEYKFLASGRTSAKDMPRTRHRELTQAHVCSAAIRVARELFALLPIARTFVHVATVQLDPATGHPVTYTLLSVEFDRERLLRSNFEQVDPASAVESFRHAMNFKKTVGLLPVDPLEPLAQLTSLPE
jgi:hypothetical protein